MNKLNYRSGFTFIELMVVVSIIAILSAIVYANFSQAREQAKNKAFRVEMKEVQLAMEVYKAQHGEYPPAETLGGNSCFAENGSNEDVSVRGAVACINPNPLIQGLVSEFISELPNYADSANPNCILMYQVEDDGSVYKLTAINCVANAPVLADDELARCPNILECSGIAECLTSNTDFDTTLALYSSGGQCW